MIIDDQADFRSLLMHHITSHWGDARIIEYDPSATGNLPDEFSGAGNDVLLLGSMQAELAGIDVLRQFVRRPGIPPIVYFGDARELGSAKKIGAAASFNRWEFEHSALIVRVNDVLLSREKGTSTGSLFVGDESAGVQPLIRGYRLVRKLSVSSHSGVYLAERTANGEKIVLKVLRQVPDAADSIGAFDRFLQEYELIADIDHPNVVRIHDLGVGDDHAHIVMEYLEGGDLKQRIAGGLTEPEAVSFLQQIAGALARVHEVGILHRDLKPGNIMLRDDNTVALIDFGLAKRMRLRMEITDSGEIFGTPYYMSPEQGHGNSTDHRSDIYSLGIIFYEMLTGLKPYRADTAMGIIYRHAQAPVPLLPPHLGHYQVLINLMLAKQPDDRMQSAAEVEEWL